MKAPQAGSPRSSRHGRLARALLLLCMAGGGGGLLSALDLPPAPPAADPLSRESLGNELRDKAEVWNLGFAALLDRGVSPGNADLAKALPRLWKQALSVSLRRQLDDETRTRLVTNLRDAAVVRAQGELSQAWLDRDTAWLQQRLNEKSAEPLLKKINDTERRLAALRAFDPAWINLADQRRLAIVDDSATEPLFSPLALGHPLPAGLRPRLQSLVFGELREDLDYLFLKLAVYDLVLDRVVWTCEWVLDPKTAQDRMGEQLSAMTEAVLGRRAAALVVSAEPSDALVTLRRIPAAGESAGAQIPGGSPELLAGGRGYPIIAQEPGGGDFRFLVPGDYELSADREGYASQTLRLSLDSGQVAEQQLELAPQSPSFFYLVSEPSGARVYYDNRFLGLAPLEVPEPAEATVLSVQAEGYRSARIVVPGIAGTLREGASLNPLGGILPERRVELIHDLIDWQLELSQRREKMFGSLAAFAIAILPPLFLDGLYKNIEATLPDEPDEAFPAADYARLAEQGNVFNYLARISLGVTAGLAINFAIDLAAYLEAADLAAGR